jgi:methylglutaconyl-CoA hydratase
MASSGCENDTVQVQRQGPVGYVHLARPERYNAFNEEMIEALYEAACALSEDDSVRAVVLSSGGKCFCAGADIEYMRRTGGYSFDENVEDATRMAKMFRAFDTIGKPLLARIQGPTFGGGVGLAAVADLVFAGPKASFSLSEVKLGILPAVIGPYITRRLGISRARGLCATALRVRAQDAVHMGLADILCSTDEEMDARIDEALTSILSCGPSASARARKIPDEVFGRDPGEVLDEMARLSATARASDEGREGLGAFLEKRTAAYLHPWEKN